MVRVWASAPSRVASVVSTCTGLRVSGPSCAAGTGVAEAWAVGSGGLVEVAGGCASVDVAGGEVSTAAVAVAGTSSALGEGNGLVALTEAGVVAVGLDCGCDVPLSHAAEKSPAANDSAIILLNFIP